MSLPTPITRTDVYLNSIATGDTSDLPEPITREEVYLNAIANGGGGGGGYTESPKSNKVFEASKPTSKKEKA